MKLLKEKYKWNVIERYLDRMANSTLEEITRHYEIALYTENIRVECRKDDDNLCKYLFDYFNIWKRDDVIRSCQLYGDNKLIEYANSYEFYNWDIFEKFPYKGLVMEGLGREKTEESIDKIYNLVIQGYLERKDEKLHIQQLKEKEKQEKEKEKQEKEKENEDEALGTLDLFAQRTKKMQEDNLKDKEKVIEAMKNFRMKVIGKTISEKADKIDVKLTNDDECVSFVNKIKRRSGETGEELDDSDLVNSLSKKYKEGIYDTVDDSLKTLTFSSFPGKANIGEIKPATLTNTYKYKKDVEKTEKETIAVLRVKPEYYKLVPAHLITMDVLRVLEEKGLVPYVEEMLIKKNDAKFSTKVILDFGYKKSDFANSMEYDVEVCKEFLKKSTINMIPVTRRKNKELAEFCVQERGRDISALNLDVFDEIYALYLIDIAVKKGVRLTRIPRKYWTKEIVYNCISCENGGVDIDRVPYDYMSQFLCEIAFKDSIYNLEHIPRNFITKEMCEIAFKHSIGFIKHIPDNLITEEMCESAFEKNHQYIRYFPKRFVTRKMAHCIIDKNEISLMKFVPSKYKTD